MPDTEILGQQFRDQFRNILYAIAEDADRFDTDIALARERGWRVIDGGRVAGGYEDDDGVCDYECHDWETGESLFAGRGTNGDFDRAIEGRAREEGRPWFLVDDIQVNVNGGETPEPARTVPVPGIPRSLVWTLREWARDCASPRELAGLTGIAVDQVEHMLRRLNRREARQEPSGRDL